MLKFLYLTSLVIVFLHIWNVSSQKSGGAGKPQRLLESPILKILPASMSAAASVSSDNKVADLKLYDLSKLYEMSEESSRRKPNAFKRYSTYEASPPAYYEKPQYGSYGKIHDTYQKKYEGSTPGKISYEIKLYIPKYEPPAPAYQKSEMPPRQMPSYDQPEYPPNYEERPPYQPPQPQHATPLRYEQKSSSYMKPYYNQEGKVMYERESKPNYGYESRSIYKPPPIPEPPYQSSYDPPAPKSRYMPAQESILPYEQQQTTYSAYPVMEKKYMEPKEQGYAYAPPSYSSYQQPVYYYSAPQERSYEPPPMYSPAYPMYPSYHTYQVYR